MSRSPQELDRMVATRHREVHVVSTLVIAALAGGLAVLWPSVQERVVAAFGPFATSRFLLGELLALVALFVAYLWRKSRQIEELVGGLIDERDRGAALEERLAQARAVLQASAQLQLDDDDAGGALRKILQCVTEALRASRGVLWRQRGEARPPEREAVFPSTNEAPDPLVLAFEDEIARKVLATGSMLVIDDGTDLKQIGVAAARPRSGAGRLVAAPLLLDGRPAGVLLLCDPAVDSGARESPLGLLEVFAGFAAGVLRNLRLFQSIARRNGELERARQLLCDHQRELAEIDAVATMSRVAKSLAHGLSGPLTAIAGYTDVVLAVTAESLALQGARDGLRRETASLKARLRRVVDFTLTWRREYGVVDLNQVVETAVALQAEPLRARGVACRFEPTLGLPFTVADPVRLRQVFLSLLAFVRSALRDGKGREVRVRTLPDGGMLRVHVDFPGRPGLDRLCAPLLDPNVDIELLARERNVELPVAVAILRDHRGNLELQLRDDGTTRMSVELPILDVAPETTLAAPPTDESFEEVLDRIFGDDAQPRAAGRTGARTTVTPATPRAAAAADAAVAATPEAALAAASGPTRLVPAAPGGPPNAGLDVLFAPGELWQGGTPRPPPRREAVRTSQRRTLLDQAEVEGALRLFDETPPAKG